jgi:HD-like signal output (HDOD) protein
MKKHILFVDDERDILEGLRNRLRHHRQKWEMSFVESGSEALAALAREPFDVIVSDMRMPGMDGNALLQQVRETYPAVTRIVLSGHANEGAMLRAVATAHQYLLKPCDPGVLEGLVDRVCGLQDLLNEEGVKKAVGKIACLPARPAVYSQLLAALANEHSDPQSVAHILKQDGALCAQLLHVVNSAYFRLARPIINIEDAVVYLGLGTVRQLAMVADVFRQANAKPAIPEMPLDILQNHALLAGGIASALFTTPAQREAAFVAALLHDIGKLLLVTELPDRVRQVMSEMKSSGSSMHDTEKRLFGATHAEIGAYLLGLWQLPFPIVEAVADHHTPGRIRQEDLELVAAVHVADVLANEQAEMTAGATERKWEIDPACLEKLGGPAKLPGWREIAKSLAQSGLARLP